MNKPTPAPNDKRHAVVHTDRYVVDIGEHVFPVAKYPLVIDRLIASGEIARDEILEPHAVEREDLLLVHTSEYIKDLTGARWTFRTMRSELPLTREIADASVLAAGGTTLAAREAVERKGFGIHVGGGFHHAFAEHAEGFCYVNDIAVAIRILQRDGLIRKAAVIDCDVHQGNGTARIFRDDDSVFTFSIHQEYNYPPKEQSDIDVGLLDGATDDDYLEALARVIPAEIDAFAPDLVLYVAGADPYREDLLGGLGLTQEGLARRDDYVIRHCADRAIPIASVLAGGYARNSDDTVDIHVTTCRKMLEAARQCGIVRTTN